jgi:hypothetical protein
MNRCVTQTFAIIFTVAVALSTAGCGANGLASVSGSVMYKGQPAKGAAVHFHRQGETPEESVNFPMGLVDDEGHFDLETPERGWGAVPGKYNVLILWPEEPPAPAKEAAPAATAKGKKSSKSSISSAAKHHKDPQSAKDRLKYRYFNMSSPLLTADIQPGSNKLEPFELKD